MSVYPTLVIASNSELDSGFSKQHRLFNKLGSNWAIEDSPQIDPTFDESEDGIDPALRFLEELVKSRQRYFH